MHESTPDTTRLQSIDLAQEADFDLGLLRVRPASCEVEWSGVSQTLQRRVMQVLVALARAHGSVVSQSDLVVRCWRGLSVSDDAIVRCISKLRKLGAGYPDAPFAIETIPGVGYRLTSPGLVEHDPSGRPAASHHRHFRFRAWLAATALAILAALGGAIWIYGGSEGHHPLRVAVQPFEALSNSRDIRSLARRIPNEIVDALGDSQIETALAGAQAGSETASDLIVMGILREDGRHTIVDLRIESGATHAALWSTEFKRDRDETSDLPLEVAARVADVVNVTSFARSANPSLADDSALSALLQATDMIRDPRDGAWAPMLERAQGLVARHPEFAFGHSVLATAYAEAAQDAPDRARAMNDAARREARLTLRLDAQDAGAYVILSELEPRYDYRGREALLLRGISRAKHPKEPLGALYSYEGVLLDNVGRLREGLSYQLIAQATDEWSPAKMAKLAFVYANMGKLPVARGWIEKAIQRWPNHSGVRAVRRYIAGFYEKPADAVAIIDSMDASTSPDQSQTAIWRSFIEAKAAHSVQATEATVRKIREAADQGTITRETEIMMLAGLDETELAINAANLAVDHQQLEPRFLFTPVTRNIRQDPGFVGLAARMGLIRYWRETGKRPDFCTDQATRSECSPQLLAALNAPS
jgi:DNA-binding winged helix-turn-helix (wHTH) protein/TolB-like protein/tetratricopeptide (TPR) repeat protein